MSIHLKVEGGTASGKENLCINCRWYKRVIFHKGESIHKCQEFNRNLLGPVFECTEYDDQRNASLYDMKEQAWIIIPGKQHLGFRKQRDLTEREKTEYDNENY